MSVTIKSSKMKYKDSNGEYVGVDVVAERSAEEIVGMVQTEGTSQMNAVAGAGATALTNIQNKADEVTSQLASSGEMEDMVADTFESNKNYLKGKYIIHTNDSQVNKLYNYTKDHTAGSWDSTEVREAKLGDDVSELKSAFVYQISKKIGVSQGFFAVASGEPTASDKYCKSEYVESDCILETSTYTMFLLAYQIDGTYVGCWTGSTFSTTFSTSYGKKRFDIDQFLTNYPNYTFKVDYYNSNSTLTPADVLSDLTVIHKFVDRIKNNISVSRFQWEQGYIDGYGANQPSDYRIRTKYYIDLDELDAPFVAPEDGYKLSVTYYNSSFQYVSPQSGWKTKKYVLDKTQGKYCRIVLASTVSDQTAILPSEHTNLYFYNSNAFTPLYDLIKRTSSLENTVEKTVEKNLDNIEKGFFINTSYQFATSENGYILVMPIKHGHKYNFYSTGGNRWRVGLGNSYDIYEGLTCDVQVASGDAFLGTAEFSNTTYDFAYVYFYNGTPAPSYEYELIDLTEINTKEVQLYKGRWFNNTVRAIALGVETIVFPIEKNSNYLLKVQGGNRRNIALTTKGIPENGDVVTMLNAGTSTDDYELNFNSGENTYLYVYYASNAETQAYCELIPQYTNRIKRVSKVFKYSGYHSSSNTPNVGTKFVIGSYNVAKYTNDTDLNGGTPVYISNEKLHNLKNVIAELNADVLIADEDLGYIDANQEKSSHDYVFRPVYPFVTGSAREKIYSKVPFITTENKTSPNSRPVTFATISVSSKTVLVVCVHAKPGISESDQDARAEDLTWLLEQVDLQTYDYCMLVGDFNPEAGDPDLTEMETQFGEAGMVMCNGGRFDYINTWFERIPGSTYAIAEAMPLDYVITSGNVVCNKFRAYQEKYNELYSDHVPIVADLTLLET